MDQTQQIGRVLRDSAFLASLMFLVGACSVIPLREPASKPMMPMRLICAGAADGTHIFGLVPSNVQMQFNEDGSADVAGVVRMTTRADDSIPDFDGDVYLTGRRTPDGLIYRLRGQAQGQGFTMELISYGPARLVRSAGPGIPGPAMTEYSSRCQPDQAASFKR